MFRKGGVKHLSKELKSNLKFGLNKHGDTSIAMREEESEKRCLRDALAIY